MSYAKELKKYVTSQYIYSGIRIALAIVIPSIVLAYFGLLQEYFLFPLATSFIGLTDMPGPYHRRRNALMFSVFLFTGIALLAALLKDYPILTYVELGFFGLILTLIGVYGQRVAAIGGLALVVLSIFIDGSLLGSDITKSILTFFCGALWFLVIFIIVTSLQPYKLASQMIGENYFELSKFLKIKAKFYKGGARFTELMNEVMTQQIVIKNLQEETRETVFKTRLIVNESTTTSRMLMLTFLNSLDLHEKLMTSENDYKKLREAFAEESIMENLYHYLMLLADELENIGIALQSGSKPTPLHAIDKQMMDVYNQYLGLRQRRLNDDNFDYFLILRQIIKRISDIKNDIQDIYLIFHQDDKLASSLSTGLDFKKFVPKNEKLNLSVLLNNLSLKSIHFRHAIRMTVALLLGYAIAELGPLNIGHSYWILITIIAIIRPAYATTKHRNLLRLYGTLVGAVIAYILLITVTNPVAILSILLLSMVLCFSFLKGKYFWAVLFMTIYIFLSFNYLNPGNINTLFKDRIIDTLIAGGVTFAVTYFLLPVWEHTKNLDFMRASAKANLKYFDEVIAKFTEKNYHPEKYRIARKDAIISLANLSDNFQRMISDPKHQQKKLELVHQYVNTSHLITAYTASLSQYTKTNVTVNEIDFEAWKLKIAAELQQIVHYLHQEEVETDLKKASRIAPDDIVDELLQEEKKKSAIEELFINENPTELNRLTELKNAKELLQLLYDVAREQRKITQKVYEIITSPQS